MNKEEQWKEFRADMIAAVVIILLLFVFLYYL